MYKVISFFTDLQDGNHPYNVGDAFPRKGKTATEERLKELAGPENKQKRPLIALAEEEGTDEQVDVKNAPEAVPAAEEAKEEEPVKPAKAAKKKR